MPQKRLVGWFAITLALSTACSAQENSPALIPTQDASAPGGLARSQPDAAAATADLAAGARSAAEQHGGAVGRSSRRDILLASISIFVLAVFLGFEVINKVPPILHTPLMSGSNAISGITVVGALTSAGVTSSGWLIPLLGTAAVIFATINVVGGFTVTHRMLAMFRRKP